MDTNFFLLVGSLSYAVLLVVWSSKKLAITETEFLGPMKGVAKWDPKESWASNLTAAGTILVTVVSAKPIQETLKYPAEYFVLSVFFAALGIVAPFFYNATCKEQSQGYVWSFLIATIMTVWSASGQLTTLGLLVRELYAPEKQVEVKGIVTTVDGIYPLVFVFVEALLFFTLIMIIPYTIRSIRVLIEKNRTPAEKALTVTEFVTIDVRPSWSIL